MDNYQKLQDLARALANANADVSELFAQELGRAARSAKVGGMGHGIAVRHNSLTGALEVRGGFLVDYIEGRPPGDGYEEASG